MEVLVVGMIVASETMEGVVNHHQDILVERVVQAHCCAVKVTTTHTGSASARPVFHVASCIVMTATGVEVLAVGEVVKTCVVVASHKFQSSAVQASEQTIGLVVTITVAKEDNTCFNISAMEVVGTKLVSVVPCFYRAPTVNVVLSIDHERIGVAFLCNVLVEVLTTQEETVVVIQQLGANVSDGVCPLEVGIYKLLILINLGLH